MFDFIKNRKIFFGISLFVIIAGIILTIMNGLVMDIQFEGGTIMQIQTYDKEYTSEEIEALVIDAIGKKPSSVQRLSSMESKESSILMIKFRKSDALKKEENDALLSAIKERFSFDNINASYETVEPFIGRELLNRGLLATLISSLLIFIYVWWRFSAMSGVPAAATALIALLHDAFVMLAFYAIFRLPINDTFIAAILTILGYSINDTIVIYDRVRENRILIRKSHNAELMNRSINQSLSRSINTTVTTLITIVVVYIFASIYNITSLKEFALPLIVGMIAGVYSTIFIAGPLWVMWKNRAEKKISSASATRKA